MNIDIFMLNIFPVMIISFLIISGFSGLYASIYSTKLYFYLRKYKNKKWKKQVFLPNFIFGFANPFRGLSYIFNKEDLNNKNIKIYKGKIKFALFLIITCFILLLITIFLIILLSILFNY